MRVSWLCTECGSFWGTQAAADRHNEESGHDAMKRLVRPKPKRNRKKNRTNALSPQPAADETRMRNLDARLKGMFGGSR